MQKPLCCSHQTTQWLCNRLMYKAKSYLQQARDDVADTAVLWYLSAFDELVFGAHKHKHAVAYQPQGHGSEKV